MARSKRIHTLAPPPEIRDPSLIAALTADVGDLARLLADPSPGGWTKVRVRDRLGEILFGLSVLADAHGLQLDEIAAATSTPSITAPRSARPATSSTRPTPTTNACPGTSPTSSALSNARTPPGRPASTATANRSATRSPTPPSTPTATANEPFDEKRWSEPTGSLQPATHLIDRLPRVDAQPMRKLVIVQCNPTPPQLIQHTNGDSLLSHMHEIADHARAVTTTGYVIRSPCGRRVRSVPHGNGVFEQARREYHIDSDIEATWFDRTRRTTARDAVGWGAIRQTRHLRAVLRRRYQLLAFGEIAFGWFGLAGGRVRTPATGP
jgi:hypothetical protein